MKASFQWFFGGIKLPSLIDDYDVIGLDLSLVQWREGAEDQMVKFILKALVD